MHTAEERHAHVWDLDLRIEKGVVRFKLLGGGTCFTMSSNSGVMVMLAEAVAVLGLAGCGEERTCFKFDAQT